jgi:hypothetical protein
MPSASVLITADQVADPAACVIGFWVYVVAPGGLKKRVTLATPSASRAVTETAVWRAPVGQ